MQHGVFIVPDGQTMLCYSVDLPQGAVPQQLLVKYNDKTLSIALPVLP